MAQGPPRPRSFQSHPEPKVPELPKPPLSPPRSPLKPLDLKPSVLAVPWVVLEGL